jgi:hypothetical protein
VLEEKERVKKERKKNEDSGEEGRRG